MKGLLILIIPIITSSCKYKNSYEEQPKPIIDSLELVWNYIYGERLSPDDSDSSQIAYTDSTKLFLCFKKNDTLIVVSKNKQFWMNNRCNFANINNLIKNFPHWDLDLDTCVNLPRYACLTLDKDTLFYIRDHIINPDLWVLTNAHLFKYNQKIFNLHVGENIHKVLEDVCAENFFSNEIKHLIITNFCSDKRYFQSSQGSFIHRYVVYIKIHNLIVTEIRIGDIWGLNGEIVDCEYYIL